MFDSIVHLFGRKTKAEKEEIENAKMLELCKFLAKKDDTDYCVTHIKHGSSKNKRR